MKKRMRKSILCLSLSLALGLALFSPAGAAADASPEYPDITAQYEAQKSRIDAALEAITLKKVHPCVFVTTLNGKAVDSKEEYVSAMIDVFNCGDEYRLTAPGGIRVRGNSSADQNEDKPFRIKFTQKQNMLGLHDGMAYKSWVLLRTGEGLTLDYLAFKLAKTIFAGKYYSSDCAFVNLYVNGEYCGIYVLCEQNQAARGRIQVYEPGKGETRTDIGYVLELDNYASDEHPFFRIEKIPEVTDITGVTKELPGRNYSIKSDVRSEEQIDFIRRYLTGVFTILYRAAVDGEPMMLDDELQVVSAAGVYETGFDAVNAVMDLESLANMVILEELVHNYDVGSGSFFMAVDFSDVSIYPRLTFLAPWDHAWAYQGDPGSGYFAVTFQPPPMRNRDRSNGWYILAMNLDGFQEMVKDKWRTLSESGVLTDTVDRVDDDCRALARDLSSQPKRISNAVKICNFVRKRIEWLNGQWL